MADRPAWDDMKRSHLIAALLSTLAAGFLVGRVSSNHTAGKSAGDETDDLLSKSRTRVADRRSSDAPDSPGARLKQDIRKVSPDRIPDLVYRALETGDPILRRQLMSELYSRMDATNYRRMMEEILRVSDETGREYPEEYLLMSMRAGQIAGHDAMEGWKAKGIETEAASRTLTGWAHVDPDAAQRWLEANPDLDPKVRNKLLNALLTGAMANDPQNATRLFTGFPEEDRDRCLATFTNQIVQIAGKDAGMDWLKSTMTAGADDAYIQRAGTSMFDRILWSGANRQNAASMVRDLEQLASVFPHEEDWLTRGMGQIRDRKTIGGIELLDELSRSPVFKDKPITQRQWNSAVDFALQRDPAAVEKWLAENPSSPIHPTVQEMTERKKANQMKRDPFAPKQ